MLTRAQALGHGAALGALFGYLHGALVLAQAPALLVASPQIVGLSGLALGLGGLLWALPARALAMRVGGPVLRRFLALAAFPPAALLAVHWMQAAGLGRGTWPGPVAFYGVALVQAAGVALAIASLARRLPLRRSAPVPRWEGALPVGAGILLGAGALWPGSAGDVGAPRGVTGRPNLVLISIDALRPDHLGCYGYPFPTSPSIDALARSGVLVETLFAPRPQTTASHATILTGLYPASHGAVHNADLLPGDVTTLAEVLHDAGYTAAAFLNNANLDARLGFSQGFQVFVLEGSPQGCDPPEIRPLLGTLPAAGALSRALDVDLSFLLGRRWLEAGPREPFLLFLHLLDPHAPYDPEERWTRPLRARWQEYLVQSGGQDDAGRVMRYDGEIRRADAKVGEILAALDRTGVRGRTVVALTSDHGENMREHGAPYCHKGLYDSSLRTPLILSAPGRHPAGLRIGGIAEGVDILPTLLALLSVPAPAGLPGADLLAAGWRGTRGSFAFAGDERHAAVRTAEWRYIRGGPSGREELYYLPGDLGEQVNLVDQRREVADSLAIALGDWERQQEARARRPQSGIERLGRQGRERLRSLGYLR